MTEFINSKLNESAFVIRQNHRAQLPKQGVARDGSSENLACFRALSQCGALAISGALLLLWMPALWGAEAASAEQANGLQCRLIAVSTDSVDDAPEPSKQVNSFANDNAVAFAVELRNMSDQPITLLDSEGRLNAQHFGPYLFEFDFTNADGSPVPRAERTIFGDGIALQGAAAKELAPGESLTVLLRPAGFMRPMNYDLPPGQYRARARYHGPSQSALSLIKQHWPDSPQAKVWTGEVGSNEVAFRVARNSDKNKPAELVWGPEKDGLRAAIAYQLAEVVGGDPAVAPGVPVGTKIGVVFHVQNVSDHAITFVSEAARQDDWIHVTDSEGEEVRVRAPFYTGWPIDVRWKLNPGESAQLPVLDAGLDSINAPGEYSVRYTIRFGSRQSKDKDGKVVFPPPGDWKDDLETGVSPLFLTSRPMNAEAIEPVPRLQVRVAHLLDNQGEIAAAKNAGDKNLLSWSPADTDTEWLLFVDAAPLFTERDVESVQVKPVEGAGDWRHAAAISLTEAAGERMKRETADLLQDGIDPSLRVVVMLDGKVLASPALMNAIGRKMELSGIRDRKLAESLVKAATARSAAHDDSQSSRTPETPAHSLTVQLHDRDDQPIPGVMVLVYDGNYFRAGQPVRFQQELGTSDREGRVVFAGLLDRIPADCSYQVQVQPLQGAKWKPPRHVLVHNGKQLGDDPLINVDRIGNESVGIAFALREACSLEFEVVDAMTGKPIHFAQVLFQGKRVDQWTRCSLQDSDGQKDFTTIVPEMSDSRFLATREGYYPREFELTEQLEPDRVVKQRIELRPAPLIELTVVDGQGKPVVGAILEYAGPQLIGSRAPIKPTDADGRTVLKYPEFGERATYRIKHGDRLVDFTAQGLPKPERQKSEASRAATLTHEKEWALIRIEVRL